MEYWRRRKETPKEGLRYGDRREGSANVDYPEDVTRRMKQRIEDLGVSVGLVRYQRGCDYENN